ncbi:MAG: phosphopantetheine-binding protein [Rhodanobacteraceae bacterium]
MERTEERARSIIRNQLGLREEDPIGLDARIADLGADDLDNVEIILALEEEFECAIPDSAAERMTTFGEMMAFLHGREAEIRAA